MHRAEPAAAYEIAQTLHPNRTVDERRQHCPETDQVELQRNAA